MTTAPTTYEEKKNRVCVEGHVMILPNFLPWKIAAGNEHHHIADAQCEIVRFFYKATPLYFKCLELTYTANLYRDYREFTGITCTLYRVFPVTGKNL